MTADAPPPLTLPEVTGLSPKEAALLYGSHGWPVFPCEASNHDPEKNSWSKRPHPMLRDEEAERGMGGWKLATTDPDTIARWWDRDPDALIGLPPGMAGAVVLDADGAQGIKALYDAADADFDQTSTPVSRTPGKGGGMHVWFDRRHLDGVIGNGSLRNVPGEARGDRGYVIAPGSKMPDGGEYAFTGHTYDLMPLPAWASSLLPWEIAGAGGTARASIADVTKGDELEWLLGKSAEESDAQARTFVAEAVSRITRAPAGDVQQGRHPTATRMAASLLSKAQRREFEVNLVEALGAIRDALVSVKPEGGGDFDRFVSDAVALRVAEDRGKAASVVDVSLLRVAEEEQAVWSDPEELGHRGGQASRPFPVDALPDVMRRAVEEVAKATQMSEILPAMAALGTASAATAGGITVSLAHTWEEGLSLYLIGVADPSERKTAALKPFVDSIRYAAKQWIASTAHERAAWDAEGASIEARMKEAKKLAGTPEGQQEIAKLTLEVEDHEREGKRLILPTGIIHSDPTQEALVAQMAEQHGVAFLASSEGAFVANLAGRYSSTKDRNDLSVVNEAYSRSFIRTTRVTRGDVVVEIPHLSIVSFIQPRIAEQLAHPDFEGSGFLSRVFYAHPPSIVGHRETKVGRYSPFYTIAMDAWRQRVEAIFARGWSREEDPFRLMLETGTHETFEKWWAMCESLSPTDPWWGKAHGGTVRVGALMELIEDPTATHVSKSSIEAAIEVMEFFAEQRALMRSAVIYGERASFEMSEQMRRAIIHMARRWDEITERGGHVRVRDLCRWLRVSSSEGYALAEEMVLQGWLREGEATRVNTPTYVPHPSVPDAAVALADASVGTSTTTSTGGARSVATVASKEASVEPSVASKNPGGIRENGGSVEVSRGGPPAHNSLKDVFSSSSSSSLPESSPVQGEGNEGNSSFSQVEGVSAEDKSRGEKHTRGDAGTGGARHFDTSPKNPGSDWENGRDTSFDTSRDSATLQAERAFQAMSEGVDRVLAEPDVQQALSGLVPEVEDGVEEDAPVDESGHTYDRGEVTTPDSPPVVEDVEQDSGLVETSPGVFDVRREPTPEKVRAFSALPRCPRCGKPAATLADGRVRCAEHGEQSR